MTAPAATSLVIDSQSIKAAEAVGKDSRGYAGKKINGRKRHLVVDTKGLPLFVMVTPADMTDRNPAKEVLFRLRLMHPEITIAWADCRLCRTARDLGEDLPEPDDQDRQPPEGRLRVRRSAPALGRRTLTRLDHARPPTRARLRTAHPALGIAHHLGRDHHHDQANHPPKLPKKRTAGLPRGSTGLIVLKVRAITLALPQPEPRPEHHSPTDAEACQ